MDEKRALILIHPGFEELEAAAPIDLLVRAGIEVHLASMTNEKVVRGRNGLAFETTHFFEELNTDELYDAVILPGGPGIQQLRKDPKLCEYLKRHLAAGNILACICAAPLLLLDCGLLPEHYTAHPSTLTELPQPQDKDLVWDGRILTSKGAGTATQFGLALIEALRDATTRRKVADSICWPESDSSKGQL